MASPQTRIVSLTITEGGYYIDQATGGLDDRRRILGLSPFTLMSCDNIQSNGEVAKKLLTAFAELSAKYLAKSWQRLPPL